MIQLNNFPPTLAHLLEHLSIKEPEAQEWTTVALENTARDEILAHVAVTSPCLELARLSLYDKYNTKCK